MSGRPPRSLAHQLRWLLLLVLPWGLLLATGAYAIRRSCYEDLHNAELAIGVSDDEYCSAMLRDQLPATVIVVTAVVVGVALLWTATVLLRRGRRASRGPATR